MAKFLITALILTSMVCRGQKLILTPYKVRNDSLATSKLNLKLDNNIKKDLIATWRPYDWVKFTFKTRLNKNVVQKLDLANGVSNIFSDLDVDDYLSVGTYDIRCKFYLTKQLRLVGRVFFTGIETGRYLYSGGLVLKM